MKLSHWFMGGAVLGLNACGALEPNIGDACMHDGDGNVRVYTQMMNGAYEPLPLVMSFTGANGNEVYDNKDGSIESTLINESIDSENKNAGAQLQYKEGDSAGAKGVCRIVTSQGEVLDEMKVIYDVDDVHPTYEDALKMMKNYEHSDEGLRYVAGAFHSNPQNATVPETIYHNDFMVLRVGYSMMMNSMDRNRDSISSEDYQKALKMDAKISDVLAGISPSYQRRSPNILSVK